MRLSLLPIAAALAAFGVESKSPLLLRYPHSRWRTAPPEPRRMTDADRYCKNMQRWFRVENNRRKIATGHWQPANGG